jgi:hypothetical protein
MDACPSLNDIMEIRRVRKVPKTYLFKFLEIFRQKGCRVRA